LRVQRRVILSGTPIQNDLSEYFSLLNFANPDYLGSRMDFRKNYELAILRGRDADATDKEKENSEAKLKELAERVSKFIIRRTNDLLSKYRKSIPSPALTAKAEPFNQFLSNTNTSSSALYHLYSSLSTGTSSNLPKPKSCCAVKVHNH